MASQCGYGMRQQALNGRTNFVTSVTFPSDGTRSDDKSVRVWDSASGKALKRHTRDVRSVALSTDGTRIVSSSHVGSVRVWEKS